MKDMPPRENVQWIAASEQSQEGCARHWWHEFLSSRTTAGAISAYTLFTSCADQREWRHIDESNFAPTTDHNQRWKLIYVMLQEFNLAEDMKENQCRIESRFLGEHKADGVVPWLGGANHFAEDS